MLFNSLLGAIFNPFLLQMYLFFYVLLLLKLKKLLKNLEENNLSLNLENFTSRC
jgi:hypothetical protein